jgi:hypothetical protein
MSVLADAYKAGQFNRRKNNSEIIVLASSSAQVTAPANDTNENVLATVTVPAGAMGANGWIRVWATFGCTNSSNTKVCRVRLGSPSANSFATISVTTSLAEAFVAQVQNRSSESSQVIATATGSLTGLGNVGTGVGTLSVDTSAETTLYITGQKNTGSETLTLERYVVELHYAA